MCFAGAGVILGVMQSVVSFAAANQEYEAKAKQYRENRTNALSAGRDEQRAISLRELQEQQAHTDAKEQNKIEGAEAVAKAENAGNASGATGVSLDNIVSGLKRKVEKQQTNEDINYRMKANQLTTEMKATETTMKNRINSVSKPTAPNMLGYILQGIGGALS